MGGVELDRVSGAGDDGHLGPGESGQCGRGGVAFGTALDPDGAEDGEAGQRTEVVLARVEGSELRDLCPPSRGSGHGVGPIERAEGGPGGLAHDRAHHLDGGGLAGLGLHRRLVEAALQGGRLVAEQRPVHHEPGGHAGMADGQVEGEGGPAAHADHRHPDRSLLGEEGEHLLRLLGEVAGLAVPPATDGALHHEHVVVVRQVVGDGGEGGGAGPDAVQEHDAGAFATIEVEGGRHGTS